MRVSFVRVARSDRTDVPWHLDDSRLDKTTSGVTTGASAEIARRVPGRTPSASYRTPGSASAAAEALPTRTPLGVTVADDLQGDITDACSKVRDA